MQAALPYIRIGIPALLLVCIFIGTFGSQFIYNFPDGIGLDGSVRYYLYKSTDRGETLYYTEYGEKLFGCPQPFQIVNAALAMGVIGCASMLAAVAAAVILFKAPTNAPVLLVLRVAQVLAALSIAACLSLDIALYRSTYCGGYVSLSKTLDLDYGFIFIIVSVALLSIWRIFDCVLAPRRGTWGMDENAPLNA